MDITTLKTAVESLSSEFETEFEAKKKVIPLKNTILKEALLSQTELKLPFEKMKARAEYFEKVAEAIKEQYHSFAFGQYVSNNKRMYNGTDARKMADCDADYIEAVKVYNAAYKLRKEIQAITDTLAERHFTLKDITASVNAGTSDHIL